MPRSAQALDRPDKGRFVEHEWEAESVVVAVAGRKSGSREQRDAMAKRQL